MGQQGSTSSHDKKDKKDKKPSKPDGYANDVGNEAHDSGRRADVVHRRSACAEGAKCSKRQDATHLAACAHPFDPEYPEACRASSIEPEYPSLHGLFTWVDFDGSGKVSQAELFGAIPLLSRLQGEDLNFTEESWEELDEDGNGAVNFHEFASWAGPRLGLPLGVAHLFGGKQSNNAVWPCGIMGCPCEGWQDRDSSRDCGADNDSEGSSDEPVATNKKDKKVKKEKKEKKEKKVKGDKHGGVFDLGGIRKSLMKDPLSLLGPDKNAAKNRKKEEKRASKMAKAQKWEKDMHAATGRAAERHSRCVCGHKHKAHSLAPGSGTVDWGEVPYPLYWSKHAESAFKEVVPLGADRLPQFQQFLDATYVNTWTRDRRKHNPTQPDVPKHFRVTQVLRNESSRGWQEYCVRRAEMEKDVATGLTEEFRTFSNIKSAVAWTSAFGVRDLKDSCNEWYLFHGTSLKVAKLICGSSFKMSCAGSNTGTLYGKGTYCAESITKADEYTQPDEVTGERAVLVCRALGGLVNYTDATEPDPEDLCRSCIEGPYDCVLGDREKCRGTFKELVFFDAENLYPEYIIGYQREFSAPPTAVLAARRH